MQAAAGSSSGIQAPPCINTALPLALLSHIFDKLDDDVRDLVRAAAVCKLWHECALEQDRAWAMFFRQRWHPLPRMLGSWQQAYAGKVLAAKGYADRYCTDSLFGHGGAVRACCLVPACNAIVTGSEDQTVRLWGLEAGLPLAASRPLGSTVRCVAADERLIVCATTGDHSIRAWRPSDDAAAGDTAFDLASNTRLRGGHAGPVTRLSLTDQLLCSASLDFTARLWKRGTEMRCAAVLHLRDWVWDIVARGEHLLTAAGQSLCVHDAVTTAVIRSYRVESTHGNLAPLRVEGTRNGRLAFAGGGDGRVLCFDLRLWQSVPAAVLLQDGHAVTSLAFEDPWLACGSAAGLVRMVDIEDALRGGAGGASAAGASRRTPAARLPQPRRQLQGPGGAVSAADLSSGWLAVCGNSSTVRTYHFSRRGNAAQPPPHARQLGKALPSRFPIAPAARHEPQPSAAHWVPDCPSALCDMGVTPVCEPGSETALPAAVGKPQRRRHATVPIAAPQLSVGCRRESIAEATAWQIVRPRALTVDKSYRS